MTAEYTDYADNRLHTMANKNGLLITSAYNYAYDAAGNRVTVLDSDGTTTYVTLEEVKTDVFKYVEQFYNRKRMHASLGYPSPIEFCLKCDDLKTA